jgi:hypothetical protein
MSGRTYFRIAAVFALMLFGAVSSGIAIAGSIVAITPSDRTGVTLFPAPPPDPCKNSGDTLDFAALASTPTGSVPDSKNPNFPTHWIYAICLPSGTFSETFPIDLVDTDDGDNSGGCTGTTSSVQFSSGGSISGLTKGLPADFDITDDGSVVHKSIVLNGVGVAPGTYNINVQIKGNAAFQRKLTLKHDHVQIQLIIGSACATPSACFFTDGAFNDLVDCAGAPVDDSTGGTFQIVGSAHHGTIVSAVNPGEIFYNFIWSNSTGEAQDLWICLEGTNVSPMGAQSVHAATFSTGGAFLPTLIDFDLVGSDGLPCGPWGPCEVNVAADETLWVQWHLRPSLVGGSTYGISSTCPGNRFISATATLWTGECEGDVVDTCTADASGYLK